MLFKHIFCSQPLQILCKYSKFSVYWSICWISTIITTMLLPFVLLNQRVLQTVYLQNSLFSWSTLLVVVLEDLIFISFTIAYSAWSYRLYTKIRFKQTRIYKTTWVTSHTHPRTPHFHSYQYESSLSALVASCSSSSVFPHSLSLHHALLNKPTTWIWAFLISFCWRRILFSSCLRICSFLSLQSHYSYALLFNSGRSHAFLQFFRSF